MQAKRVIIFKKIDSSISFPINHSGLLTSQHPYHIVTTLHLYRENTEHKRVCQIVDTPSLNSQH